MKPKEEKSKKEEEVDEILEKMDKLTDLLLDKTKIEKGKVPTLTEYMNKELLELHYCRKGTKMQIKTTDPKTKKLMMSDIIGHLLSQIPEEDRNDVLLVAVKISHLDDLEH